MKKTQWQFLFIVLLLVYSCTSNNESNKTETKTVSEETDNIETETVDEDCIFDNDYESLTKEWLAELGIENYTWNETLKKAEITDKSETVFISQGGCYSMSFDVELKTFNDTVRLSDSAFWVGKAFELAKNYGMSEYVEIISQGKLRKAQQYENEILFELEDDDTEDNLYYSGINILQEEDSWWIKISKYYN